MAVKRSAGFATTIFVLLPVLLGPRFVRLVAGTSSADTWSALWHGGDGGLAELSASYGSLSCQTAGIEDVRANAVANARITV